MSSSSVHKPNCGYTKLCIVDVFKHDTIANYELFYSGVCKYYIGSIGDLTLSTSDFHSCRLGIDCQRTHSLHRNDMAIVILSSVVTAG